MRRKLNLVGLNQHDMKKREMRRIQAGDSPPMNPPAPCEKMCDCLYNPNHLTTSELLSGCPDTSKW
jgi:hypothetical protein